MSRLTMDRMSILQQNKNGRLSMLLNEDDYDYALELRPDDEYRQAAEALPKLVDFDDIDFSNIVNDTPQPSDYRQNDNIRPFSATATEDATAANTKRNRMSNFDTSMLDLHAANTTQARRSSLQHRNSNVLSDWGAVDNEIEMTHVGQGAGNHHSGSFESAEDNNDEGFAFDEDDLEQQYDTTITGMGTGALGEGTGINFNATSGTSSSESSSFSSRWKRLSKKEFSFRLNLLEKHRKWVERAARRSSIGFHRHHPSSDKEAMDRFLVALAGGVHVRRHQGYRLSEVVRVYSTTGCKLIEWDKPKARDLHAQRHKLGGPQQSGSAAIYSTKYDKSAFDCCIAICGCGDDLNAGHDPNHLQTSENTMNTEAIREDNRYLNFGRTFYNIGYRRRGTFRDLDILAVHPAGIEDPTVVGMLGTECLRRTKDAFNPELTFSVIVRDTTSTQGYSTLDIECETADMYYLLLRGFRLLQEEAEARRAQQRSSGNSSSNGGGSTGSGLDGDMDVDIEAGAGDRNSTRRNRFDPHNLLHSQRVDELSRVWNSVKDYITGDGNAPVLDPISELFAPSSQLDPLRALRVGGGLLPAHSVHKPQHITSPINSPNGPASPASPSLAHGFTQTNSLPLAQFLGWTSAGTQIWARLKMAGLDVKCVLSWDLKRVILKIRCPAWRLEQMAEQMHLKLKSRDGYLKQFKVSRRDTFVAMGDKGAMFRSSERQQIIDYIIRSKIKDGGAELDENTELGKQIVQRFPLHMYSKLADIRHAWVTFWKRERYGEISSSWSPFTESYAVTYGRISESVAYFSSNLLTQPLDSIAEYFGENIAFYFAYMAFYTRWLVFPSVLGVIVFACQVSENRLDHWLCPIYAVVVMIWACFMLAFWRQKASALAHRWGVLDYEVEETERPQFRGAYTYDESSGEVRKTYSLWKRTGKYFLSIPVLSAAILVTLVIMTTVFYSQDQMYNDYLNDRNVDFAPKFPTFGHSSGHVNTTFLSGNTTAVDVVPVKAFSLREINNSDFWAATFFYPSLYGIVVSVLTIVFEFIAVWLNDFENHRTQTTYINRLILKVFSFQFVTIFTSLYYYAFFLSDQEGAFYQISITVFSLMTVGQWWSMFLDIVVPSIYHRALLYRMKSAFANTNRKIYRAREYTDKKQRRAEASGRGRSFGRSLTAIMNEKLNKRMSFLEQGKSKCWEEALQAKYNNFTDYTNMVIQIGFVLFFSAVFPLCPLIALINNLLLIRFNALKICYTRQRPIAQKIGGIGVWEDVLQIMSVGGILTNCALYGFTSDTLQNLLVPSMGKTGMAVLLFAYEHAILLFKYWLHGSIPSVHPSVQRARSRERKSSDRKSMLRREKLTKHGHRRSVLGDPDSHDAGQGGGNGGAAGTGTGKKPLRAQSSMLGYWFDLSNRAVGDHDTADAGGEAGGQTELNDDSDEGTSLLQVHVPQSVPFSAAAKDRRSNVSIMSREHKLDFKADDSDDCLRSEVDEGSAEEWEPQYPQHGSHHNVARELLEEESIAEYDHASALQYQQQPQVHVHVHVQEAQHFGKARSSIVAEQRRSVSPQPVRAGSPVRAHSPARDLSPPRDCSPQRSPRRRSVSPSPVRPVAPDQAPQISRDEMIEIIYANLNNNMLAQMPVEVQLASHAPAPTAAAHQQAMFRRVSFVDCDARQPISMEPAPSHAPSRRVSYAPVVSAPAEQEYESDSGSESDSAYEDFDENVSDLSLEDEWLEGEDPALDGYATPPKGDLWQMTFTQDTSGKSGGGGANIKATGTTKTTKRGSNVKYTSVKSPARTRSPTKRIAPASATSRSAHTPTAPAPVPTQTAPVPAGVSNVQDMLTNWFWPTKKAAPPATASANKSNAVHSRSSITASGNKHHTLNIAPLGKGKITAVPTPVPEKKVPVTPIISPIPIQFQEVQSPYAALLTPPVVIAPVKNTPAQSVSRLQIQNPRDLSPPRTPIPGSGTAPADKETPSKTKRTPQPSKTAVAATPPARIFSPAQITSPFSYTEYTPEPSYQRSEAMLSKENASILANLQTQQLHQLLLMQQQQQAQSSAQPPAGGAGKRKLVVSAGAAVVDGSAPSVAVASSPTRSAIAGSRKRQQQQQVLQVLGGQASPNPYYPILQDGYVDGAGGIATVAQPAYSSAAARQTHQQEKRPSARTVLPYPATVAAPAATPTIAPAPVNTPRRRLSVHNNNPSSAQTGTGGAGGTGSKATTAGPSVAGTVGNNNVNPFSFAVQKRPERVMYD